MLLWCLFCSDQIKFWEKLPDIPLLSTTLFNDEKTIDEFGNKCNDNDGRYINVNYLGRLIFNTYNNCCTVAIHTCLLHCEYRSNPQVLLTELIQQACGSLCGQIHWPYCTSTRTNLLIIRLEDVRPWEFTIATGRVQTYVTPSQKRIQLAHFSKISIFAVFRTFIPPQLIMRIKWYSARQVSTNLELIATRARSL